jgi:hypothetical protein
MEPPSVLQRRLPEWDAFADVDVFVGVELAEFEAMAKDGVRPLRSGSKPPLAGAALREAVMALHAMAADRTALRPPIRQPS